MMDWLSERQAIALIGAIVGLAMVADRRLAPIAVLFTLVMIVIAIHYWFHEHMNAALAATEAGRFPPLASLGATLGAMVIVAAAAQTLDGALGQSRPLLRVDPAFAVPLAFAVAAIPAYFAGRRLIRRSAAPTMPPLSSARELFATAAWHFGFLVMFLGVLVLALASPFAGPHPISMVGLDIVLGGAALAFAGAPLAFVSCRGLDEQREQ